MEAATPRCGKVTANAPLSVTLVTLDPKDEGKEDCRMFTALQVLL
jgi:hypothetical protein